MVYIANIPLSLQNSIAVKLADNERWSLLAIECGIHPDIIKGKTVGRSDLAYSKKLIDSLYSKDVQFLIEKLSNIGGDDIIQLITSNGY